MAYSDYGAFVYLNGEDKPTKYTFDDLSRKFGWDDYEEYDNTRYAADKYD